jgi:hypothetical protein
MDARGRRLDRMRAGILLASALFAASLAAARADPIDALQGAWVMEISDCASVFEKIDGKIRFKDRNYALDSGFIISGSNVKGPLAGCTISQVAEENDRFSILLSCSDALLSRKFSMTFRIVDETHFERLDPKSRDVMYKQCVF